MSGLWPRWEDDERLFTFLFVYSSHFLKRGKKEERSVALPSLPTGEMERGERKNNSRGYVGEGLHGTYHKYTGVGGGGDNLSDSFRSCLHVLRECVFLLMVVTSYLHLLRGAESLAIR